MSKIATAHAVIRHLTRVRGVDLAPIKEAMLRMGIEDMTDGSVLSFIRAYTNIDLEPSNRAIDTQIVRLAVNCGARAIVSRGLRYLIDGPVVASVLPSESMGWRKSRMIRRGDRRPNNWRTRVMEEVEA